MLLRKGILAIILIISTLHVLAQTRAKVSGSVVNASTKEAISDAAITLLDAGTGKTVNGALSDSIGHFSINDVAPGTYIIKVDFVGFKTYAKSGVKVSGHFKMGTLSLTPTITSLQDVTITGNKPLVENHIDKMVYNVANDLTSQSGVALDVLKKVPSVSVDIDGNVSLEGDANIRFLINGKPSTIFGSSLTDALQSIPASQIKSIEVITSPGAKYDASGTGGIINIVLKESRVQGINGIVNASVGTRLENGSFNLSVRKNKLGFNAFFSGNSQLNMTTLNTLKRQSWNPTMDTLTDLNQNGSSSVKRSSYQTGLSSQWDISSRDKLSASVTFNHFGNSSHGTTDQQQQLTDSLGNVIAAVPSILTSGSQNSANAFDWSVDYKKNFRNKDQELDILVTTSSGKNQSEYYQQQDYPTGIINSSGSRGNSPGNDKETDVSIDYAQPVGKGIILETGAKGVFEKLSNTVTTDTLLADKTYGPNYNQTYGFTYNRQVFAGYFSGSFSAFHEFIEGKAGLRYEFTHTTADFPGTYIPDYGILAPSLVLSHKLDETQSIKVAYSYRIERPDYMDLNPYYNISDPHNISTGNPNLKPEIGHRYEIGYNKNFKGGGNLYVSALYRQNTDDIQSIATYYPSLVVNGTTYYDVSLTQRYNLGSEMTPGGNIFASIPITSALNIRSNINLGERINKTPGYPTTQGFMFRGNLNVSYAFPQDFRAEIFGNYNSSQRTIQGTRPSFAFYTIAARKEFMHKKASLGLTATNPFNMYVNQKATLSGSNFTQSSLRQVPYQSFGLSFSFKFGKLEFKEKEKDHEGDNGPAQVDQPK